GRTANRLGKTHLGILTGSALLACASLIVSAWAGPPQSRKASGAPSGGGLVLMPANISIDGSYGYQTLSAVANAPDGSSLEVTPQAAFQSSNPAVVKVQNGVAIPSGDGQAEISVSYGGRSAKAKVTVKNAKTDSDLCF